MIGVLGANGFVGSAVCLALKKRKIKYKKVTRKNFLKYQKYKFSILINSSMPSKRFWAKKYPKKDYFETVLKTKYFRDNFKYKKFVHISTISSRCQKNTVYGLNKKKSEDIIKKKSNFIIFRLGPMYGRGLNKGVLLDLISSKKVFVSKKSKYSFTNVDWVANYIVKNLKKKNFKNQVIEVGSTDYLSLEYIKKVINSKSTFYGETDNQIIKNPNMKNKSSSKNVIHYLKKLVN